MSDLLTFLVGRPLYTAMSLPIFALVCESRNSFTLGCIENLIEIRRVVPEADLAGYPAAVYKANKFAGYRICG